MSYNTPYRDRSHTIPDVAPSAQRILEKRYFQPDESDWRDVCERVSTALADDDDERRDFFWLMYGMDFLPNSPTLMNAGTDQGTLSACFVLPVEDSMEGITDASATAAMVQKFGGGTGFSLSDIRPKGAYISTTHGKACGPVAVLKYLSATSTLVTQGGKRDGANMAVMRYNHPDILEFITCKQTEGDIHNFNISVGVTGLFLHEVEDDLLVPLRHGGKEYGEIPARDIWEAIVNNAWRNGEPGLVFLDRINAGHPGYALGEIDATNPCGEQPLMPYESCNLGSINLLNFVDDAYPVASEFDWDRLGACVETAVKLLDNTISKNAYADERIEQANLRTRKIGLGVMGWADALSKLRIPYDSVEARDLARRVMRFISETAYNTSTQLYHKKTGYGALSEAGQQSTLPARRNLCVTSIAPTGTISMIAGVSSGIEPHFALAWRKQNILEGESFDFVNNEFAKAIEGDEMANFHLQDAREGLLQKNLNIDPDIRAAFKTAADISPDDHVKMQGAFQEYVDSGVSKTINLPNDATVDDVKRVYELAFDEGCKGITIYRQGSRDKEVLVDEANAPRHWDDCADDCEGDRRVSYDPEVDDEYQRPDVLEGETVRINTGRGKAYITLNHLGGQLRETFVLHGKAGGNDAAMAEALSRLIGVALRRGVPVEDLSEQLIGITDIPVWDQGRKVLSVPDAIGQALRDWGSDFAYTHPDEFRYEDTGIYECRGINCTECSNQLVMEEGCMKCYGCGWSQC